MRRVVSAAVLMLLLAGCASQPAPEPLPASAYLVPPDYYHRHLVVKKPRQAKRQPRPDAQEDESGPSVGEVVDRMQEIEGRLRDLRKRLRD